MPSFKALKIVCAVSAAVLILSGCGGGSGSGSGSPASSSSSPPSSAGSSGSTTPPSSSGSTGSSGSSGGSGSSGSTPPPPATGSAKLTWTAPVANSNGSALTNLAGYHIYYGTSAGSLSNVVNIASPSTLTYVVTNLGAGTWYFAVAAYTNTGLQGAMSNVGSKTIS